MKYLVYKKYFAGLVPSLKKKKEQKIETYKKTTQTNKKHSIVSNYKNKPHPEVPFNL